MLTAIRSSASAALFAFVVLLVTGRALADAQQCVASNNLAAELRAKQALLASRSAYRACVAAPDCPEVVRAECEAALADLKNAIPTLLVSVLDEEQHDVLGSTLTVDGNVVAMAGSPIEVDPGPHLLVATGNGASLTARVVAVETETERQVNLTFKRADRQDASGPSGAAPPTRPSRATGYVLAGAGLLAAGSFAYFSLVGYSDYQHLETCRPACSKTDVRDVRTEYLFADISLGVSVVALATAGYLIFRGPRTVGAASALSLDIIAAPQTAGLSLRWKPQ